MCYYNQRLNQLKAKSESIKTETKRKERKEKTSCHIDFRSNHIHLST